MFCSIRARAVASVAAVALALGAGTALAQPPTVDEIVARNLKSKGGTEKLRSMNTVKITGTITAQGMELPMTTWAKRPNMMRREMQLQGQKVVTAFDGTTVWLINPMAGAAEPQEVTGPPAAMAKDDADFDSLLVDYKEKGHTVEFVGTETVDGKKLQHLKITKKNGQVQQYLPGSRHRAGDANGDHCGAGRDEGGGHDRPLELPDGRRRLDAVHNAAVDERGAGRAGGNREGGVQRPDGRGAVQNAGEEVRAASTRRASSSREKGRTSTLPASHHVPGLAR